MRTEKSHRQMLFAEGCAYIIERWSSCTFCVPDCEKTGDTGERCEKDISSVHVYGHKFPSFRRYRGKKCIRLLLNGKMFVKKPQKRGISIFLNLTCYCNIFNDKKLKIMRKF